MDGKTIRLLSEYIAEQHRKEKQRTEREDQHKYTKDTNGVEDDTETFWPPDNE